MLAVFAILTITGLINVIDEFKSYPITTSVTVEHRNQVPRINYNFPFLSYSYILLSVKFVYASCQSFRDSFERVQILLTLSSAMYIHSVIGESKQ